MGCGASSAMKEPPHADVVHEKSKPYEALFSKTVAENLCINSEVLREQEEIANVASCVNEIRVPCEWLSTIKKSIFTFKCAHRLCCWFITA
jgi:hypothetical protein